MFELLSVLPAPGAYESQCPLGQAALEEPEAADRQHGLVSTVDRVEVRYAMANGL